MSASAPCGRCGHMKVDHVDYLGACDEPDCDCEEFADLDWEQIAAEQEAQLERLWTTAKQLRGRADAAVAENKQLRARIDELERRGPLPDEGQWLRESKRMRARWALDRPSSGGLSGND